MKTATATKTAVTWIILGGVAALAASMALGLPWGDNIGGVLKTGTDKTTINDSIKNLKYRWECTDGDGKIISVWQLGKGATEEEISQTNSDAISDCIEKKGKQIYASHTSSKIDIQTLSRKKAQDVSKACWTNTDNPDCFGSFVGGGCVTTSGQGGICQRTTRDYCKCVPSYDKSGGFQTAD